MVKSTKGTVFAPKTFIIFGDLGASKSTLANCIVSASGDMQLLRVHVAIGQYANTETLTRIVQVSYFIEKIESARNK